MSVMSKYSHQSVMPPGRTVFHSNINADPRTPVVDRRAIIAKTKQIPPSGATSAPPHLLSFPSFFSLHFFPPSITTSISKSHLSARSRSFRDSVHPFKSSFSPSQFSQSRQTWRARRHPRLATKVRGASCSALRVSNHSHSARPTYQIDHALPRISSPAFVSI